jgi:hypothetical protein
VKKIKEQQQKDEAIDTMKEAAKKPSLWKRLFFGDK